LRGDPHAPWFVVMPDPAVLCGVCAAQRLEEERRCAYRHHDVPTKDEVALIHRGHAASARGAAVGP
jgi:hypothetical protein